MWKSFWLDLNIRKFVTMLMSLGYTVIIGAVTFNALSNNNSDMVMYAVTGLTSTLTMCIGYYFGYTTKSSETPRNTTSKDNDSH